MNIKYNFLLIIVIGGCMSLLRPTKVNSINDLYHPSTRWFTLNKKKLFIENINYLSINTVRSCLSFSIENQL